MIMIIIIPSTAGRWWDQNRAKSIINIRQVTRNRLIQIPKVCHGYVIFIQTFKITTNLSIGFEPQLRPKCGLQCCNVFSLADHFVSCSLVVDKNRHSIDFFFCPPQQFHEVLLGFSKRMTASIMTDHYYLFTVLFITAPSQYTIKDVKRWLVQEQVVVCHVSRPPQEFMTLLQCPL